MDKIKIGIPRSIYYYYYGDLWCEFFHALDLEYTISPKTNKQIMNLGIQYATDEMCLSMKNYMGHVAFLKDKCDWILVPRIDNYGVDNQTCTNFLATYDIIHNVFDCNILNYNINVKEHQTEQQAMIEMGLQLGFTKNKVKDAYLIAKEKSEYKKDQAIRNNIKALQSKKEKILIVGHPYNLYDSYIGEPILSLLKKMDVELIYSDLFSSTITNQLSQKLSTELYWKFNKENIGAIPLVEDQIDGVVFLSTFPCGPDSLVNELVIRKMKLPYLNLILDDLDGLSGFETRIESFIDLVKERKQKYA